MKQTAPPPVVVDGVHKRFEIPCEQVNTLKERALHPFRRSPTEVLQALRGVSFSVPRGEFFGIVGRNGSGKSTLLKCLAGIYRVDAGQIYVNGRMSTFIELGVGFNPDLPARDNAALNATMLGLSPREARRRFDSVIEFAELGEFVDLKIKNYSSGMLVRLAFSVMIHVDAEILLIDEVLAVGDAAFQQKCYEEFERIRRSGATVLFVTHDMSAVQRFCDRALLLEHGRPVELGDPEHVGNRYLELNFSQEARAAEQLAAEAEEQGLTREQGHAPEQGHPREQGLKREETRRLGSSGAPTEALAGAEPYEPRREGSGEAEILEVWFENQRGERAELLPARQRCAVAMRVRFHRKVEDPLFSFDLHNSHRDHLLAASNLWSERRSGSFEAGEEAVFRVGFENVLAPDRYQATPSVAHQGGAWIDRRQRMASIVVTGTHGSDALLQLPFEVGIERRARRSDAAELAL
jgi:ABC-type polysaccharide/polyol phosphate transport system ATPase subunit